MNSSSSKRIAIVGGGISGLAAAQRIVEQSLNVHLTLIEASARLGGIIQSTRQEGFLFEHAADSFLVSPDLPWAGELCEKIGLELIETQAEHRGATILRDGQLHPVPAGLQLLTIHRFGPLLRSPLLSWSGKLRILLERFVPRKKDGREESLASFARRRYGEEMFQQVIQPLVSGIYTADPERLSMDAALPQFAKQEQEHGSLYKAAQQSSQSQDAQGARYGLFRSPTAGMQSLIDALERHLLDHGVQVRRDTPVTELKPSQHGWELAFSSHASEEYDGVMLATPIRTTAKLLAGSQPALARPAERVEHVGSAIVCLGYRGDQLPSRLTCFGSVIPHVEGRRILAVSHTNVKFPSRAPVGHVLLRVFVGGSLQPEVAELDDQDLLACVRGELSSLMGVEGDPITHKIVRWPRTTPQYNLGHRDVIAAVEQQVAGMPRFEIANNAMAGVGIPQCVRGGWKAADKLLAEAYTSSAIK